MQDFEAQTRAFAAQIEGELEAGHLNFPTSMNISLRIKQRADDPDSSIDDIVAIVRGEPVLSAKAIRMANAMLLNPYGAHITSLNNAVKRIGLAALRCLSFAVAAEQLAQDHRSKQSQQIAEQLWHHSIDIASWSYAFAHRLRTANPDAAMLAGLMVDIGQFFLLSRVSAYPALEANLDRFAEFVAVWHEPIARSVLEIFELPDDILDAFAFEYPYGSEWPPASLRDIVRTATLATEIVNPFDTLLKIPPRVELFDNGLAGIDREQFEELLNEARAGKDSMIEAICG
ncbi:MAG: HDOD domain-containing protein [Azoarcus sp.]|jgi:HD-like signal output (HDOD) protein|nr:HDOD domain-containing protein [Azoarcus sp.]